MLVLDPDIYPSLRSSLPIPHYFVGVIGNPHPSFTGYSAVLNSTLHNNIPAQLPSIYCNQFNNLIILFDWQVIFFSLSSSQQLLKTLTSTNTFLSLSYMYVQVCMDVQKHTCTCVYLCIYVHTYAKFTHNFVHVLWVLYIHKNAHLGVYIYKFKCRCIGIHIWVCGQMPLANPYTYKGLHTHKYDFKYFWVFFN